MQKEKSSGLIGLAMESGGRVGARTGLSLALLVPGLVWSGLVWSSLLVEGGMDGWVGDGVSE